MVSSIESFVRRLLCSFCIKTPTHFIGSHAVLYRLSDLTPFMTPFTGCLNPLRRFEAIVGGSAPFSELRLDRQR